MTHIAVEELDAIDGVLEGIGGQMFAKRPQQLDQEEVYVALCGSGTEPGGTL